MLKTSKSTAFDIYMYIDRVFNSKEKEYIDFRFKQGKKGCLRKIFNYIEDKYLNEVDK